jgi:hypothetical protein
MMYMCGVCVCVCVCVCVWGQITSPEPRWRTCPEGSDSVHAVQGAHFQADEYARPPLSRSTATHAFTHQ